MASPLDHRHLSNTALFPAKQPDQASAIRFVPWRELFSSCFGARVSRPVSARKLAASRVVPFHDCTHAQWPGTSLGQSAAVPFIGTGGLSSSVAVVATGPVTVPDAGALAVRGKPCGDTAPANLP
jgi:hypothetical protein